MAVPSVSKENADVIFNRANVALARSQRLVASWLPSGNDHSHQKSEEVLQREEDEMFTPVPEKLGLGAKVLPKNLANDSNSSTDRLRKQLLGRNATQRNGGRDIKPNTGSGSHAAREQSSSIPKDNENGGDDDDGEEGRSSLGKRKKRSQKLPAKKDDTDSDEDDAESRTKPSRSKKTSYLDEVLAERAKKKKKKSTKNNNNK